MFATQQFRLTRLRLTLPEDCHTLRSGAFSMHFSADAGSARRSISAADGAIFSRVGGEHADAILSFFRLRRATEGSLRCSTGLIARVATTMSGATSTSGRGPAVVCDCGKVTNRTSGPIRPVRLLHLSSYSAGTRPRQKRHRERVTSHRKLALLLNRGNEKERVSATISG
jgi:hypothetical protein